MKVKLNQTERNWERAANWQVDFSWNKSLLWDSGWSSEQFYGNFTETRAVKAFSSEVFDPIITEFEENIQFKEKNKQSLKQKRKKPNCWSKSKRFLEEPCNMESKV